MTLNCFEKNHSYRATKIVRLIPPTAAAVRAAISLLLRWWCLASPDATEWPLTPVVNVSRESRYHHSYHPILYHSFSSIFRTLLSFRSVSLRCITNNDGNYEQNISPCCYRPWQYDHIDYYIPTLILHSENHRLVRVTKFIIFFIYRWLVLIYWQWFSVNNIISITSETA